MNATTSERNPRAPSIAAGLSRRAALRGLGGGGLAALALTAGAPSGPRPAGIAAQEATPAALPPLFEEWLAVWGRDPDRADALYADEAVLEDVTAGAIFSGRDEVKAHVEDEFAALPDHTYELLSAFVAGDRAAAEFRWTATYTGTYPGLPPGTGQALSLRGAVFIELMDGRISREAHYYDAYALLVQLGLLPAPGAEDAPEATPAS